MCCCGDPLCASSLLLLLSKEKKMCCLLFLLYYTLLLCWIAPHGGSRPDASHLDSVLEAKEVPHRRHRGHLAKVSKFSHKKNMLVSKDNFEKLSCVEAFISMVAFGGGTHSWTLPISFFGIYAVQKDNHNMMFPSIIFQLFGILLDILVLIFGVEPSCRVHSD